MMFDLDQLQDTDKHVTVDGGVTLETVERFREHRDVTLVCGSKVIFNGNYEENMKCPTFNNAVVLALEVLDIQKPHKALIRIGDCAVIDHHYSNSFADIDKIYITLGYEAEYIQEYIQYSNPKNVEFIEIENWNSSQIARFKQIPCHVFDESLYYNACDNWSTIVDTVDTNTWFTCTTMHSIMTPSEDAVYSGISFNKDNVNNIMIYYKAQILT